MSKERLARLQAIIEPHSAYFIANPTDIHYFTGFNFLVHEEKEAYLVVTKDTAYLLHASFSPIKKVPPIQYRQNIFAIKLKTHLKEIKKNDTIDKILINKDYTSVSEYELLIQDFKVSAMPDLALLQIRAVKEPEEIKKIQKACQISKDAFEALQPFIKTGITEKELQIMLEDLLKEKGSERIAFPTIIAFGEHGALPHHQPTDKKLENEMAVLIDFGGTYQGYKADMTRSFWFGDTPSDEYTKVEKIVIEAYQKALTQTKQNIQEPLKQIDAAARDYITQQGYGKEFIHTTGHGIGLDIHEYPSLNWRNDELLQSTMVITIEPGIYLENRFGYRYENTILVDQSLPEKAIELTL